MNAGTSCTGPGGERARSTLKSMGDLGRQGRVGYRHQERGVTLIELLVVIVILSSVIGVVGASLMSGIRVWDTARTFHDRQSPLAIGTDMISRDVMNAVPCHLIPWQGAATIISIPTLMPGTVQGVTSGSTAIVRLGRVDYFLDTGTRSLMRKVSTYTEEAPEAGEIVIPNVDRVVFEFRSGNSVSEGSWSREWTSTSNHPAAVRMTLDVRRGADEPVTHQRIMVPWSESE